MSVLLYDGARLSQDLDSAEDPLFNQFVKIRNLFESLESFVNQIQQGNGSQAISTWETTVQSLFTALADFAQTMSAQRSEFLTQNTSEAAKANKTPKKV